MSGLQTSVIVNTGFANRRPVIPIITIVELFVLLKTVNDSISFLREALSVGIATEKRFLGILLLLKEGSVILPESCYCHFCFVLVVSPACSYGFSIRPRRAIEACKGAA